MPRYTLVSSTASAGVSITSVIKFTESRSPIVSAAANTAKNTTEAPTVFAAPRSSPAPTYLPIRTVAPMAKPTIITVSMCITWLPTATAVVVPEPLYRPTTNRSAMP